MVTRTAGSNPQMKGGFSSEKAAISWVAANCPTWQCNKSSGACDTSGSSSSSGVGSYSTGDVTGWNGASWKKVGCSYGAPSVCWSKGRTLADGDGDGRADILLNGRVHWKNMGGSAKPSLGPSK